ncbi:MAG: hypothetical protein ACLPYZ_09180 [Limisphaerales bacterium]
MASPRYDLSLVAGQLLSADRSIASPGTGQQLRKSSWREHEIPGQGGVVFRVNSFISRGGGVERWLIEEPVAFA